MKIEKAFAEVLRDLRKRRGLSQEELALISELDRTFISLLERGLRQPSLTTIFQLSSALQTSAAEIVSSVEKKLNARS